MDDGCLYTISEIAEHFRTSKQVIEYHIKKLNIAPAIQVKNRFYYTEEILPKIGSCLTKKVFGEVITTSPKNNDFGDFHDEIAKIQVDQLKQEDIVKLLKNMADQILILNERLSNLELLLKRKQTNVFVAPTFDEVKQYCLERRSTVGAEMFYEYYQSRKWKGVYDWQAKVRYWEQQKIKTSANDIPIMENEYTKEHLDQKEKESEDYLNQLLSECECQNLSD